MSHAIGSVSSRTSSLAGDSNRESPTFSEESSTGTSLSQSRAARNPCGHLPPPQLRSQSSMGFSPQSFGRRPSDVDDAIKVFSLLKSDDGSLSPQNVLIRIRKIADEAITKFQQDSKKEEVEKSIKMAVELFEQAEQAGCFKLNAVLPSSPRLNQWDYKKDCLSEIERLQSLCNRTLSFSPVHVEEEAKTKDIPVVSGLAMALLKRRTSG